MVNATRAAATQAASRGDDVRHLLQLAFPILITQLAQSANGLIDTMMAGRLSREDLAAVAVGSSLWVPLFLFLVGVMQGVLPFIAQHRGAGANASIGPAIQQGLWLSLPLGLLGFWIVGNLDPLLAIMGIEASLQPLINGYLDALAWGFPAVTAFLALRCLTDGTSRTRVAMVVSVIGTLCNIPLNYVLIYGKAGFEPMGAVGCGWATTIVMWLMLGLMVIYCGWLERSLHTGLLSQVHWPQWRELLAIMRVGIPIGVSIFIETSVFCIIALLIAGTGTLMVASHQIALNITSMIFMVPLSLSLALTVKVGQELGASNPTGVRRTVRAGLTLIIVVAALASTGVVVTRDWLAGFYTSDIEVIKLASHLLIFAALFQLSDGLQVAANGVLRGMKDTTVPMLLSLVAYWLIALPLGMLLGLSDLMMNPMGPQGFWIGLVAGLTVAAALLLTRMNRQLNALSQQQ